MSEFIAKSWSKGLQWARNGQADGATGVGGVFMASRNPFRGPFPACVVQTMAGFPQLSERIRGLPGHPAGPVKAPRLWCCPNTCPTVCLASHPEEGESGRFLSRILVNPALL